MAQLIADRRDIEFVLYEFLDTESLLKTEKFSEMSACTYIRISTPTKSVDSRTGMYN